MNRFIPIALLVSGLTLLIVQILAGVVGDFVVGLLLLGLIVISFVIGRRVGRTRE